MSQPRIVSLLPGATEWVCELGLASSLVGVSHECDYPAAVKSLPQVTRSRVDPTLTSGEIDAVVQSHSESRTPLFDLDLEQIQRLKPDYILTQTLCNVCAVSESVLQRGLANLDSCQVVDMNAMTFSGVLKDAGRLADLLEAPAEGHAAIDQLMLRVDNVRQATDSQSPPRVTLLEWLAPLYSAGHWTPELIHWAGGFDPLGKTGQPSAQIGIDDVTLADPECLLVACCGLDRQRGLDEIAAMDQVSRWNELKCVRSGQVHVFDGSAWFNRPGPRLVDALEAVAKIIVAL